MQKRACESTHRGAPKEPETSLNRFSLGVVATAGPEIMQENVKNFLQLVLE